MSVYRAKMSNQPSLTRLNSLLHESYSKQRVHDLSTVCMSQSYMSKLKTVFPWNSNGFCHLYLKKVTTRNQHSMGAVLHM